MGTTVNISCDLEFNKEYKEYPEYPHFNFVMMAAHVYDKSGTLPFPGSLSEQPAQMMDILEIIFQLDADREADIQRKQKEEMNKNGRR